MCLAGPDTVFAIYTYDERPRETTGTRYDLEKGLPRLGLGVFPICIDFDYLHQNLYKRYAIFSISVYQ